MSTNHRLALAYDMLEPGKFLSRRGERVKPALYFQAFTEARTIAIFNVVVADREPGHGGGISLLANASQPGLSSIPTWTHDADAA